MVNLDASNLLLLYKGEKDLNGQLFAGVLEGLYMRQVQCLERPEGGVCLSVIVVENVVDVWNLTGPRAR